MILRRATGCSRYRTVLLDFVDRRDARAGRDPADRSPATLDALDHLDRCPRCSAELPDVALAITGLRRIRDQVATAEPSADAWPRLLARVSRPNPAPWRWPATLGGLVASTMLVAVLVAPVAMDVSHKSEVVTSVPPVSAPFSKAELDYLSAARQIRSPQDSDDASDRESVPRLYPDGIRPTEKEVNSTNPTGRPLSVI